MSNQGPAADVVIQESDGTVVVTNHSDVGLWVMPATIEVWQGGAPWTETDPGSGQAELPPGGSLSRDIGVRTDTVRVGVRLWATPTPSADDEPWFNWIEVAP